MSILEWIGKDKVVNHHLEVPYRVLERQYSYNTCIKTCIQNLLCQNRENGGCSMIFGYARISLKTHVRDGNSLEAQQAAMTAAGAEFDPNCDEWMNMFLVQPSRILTMTGPTNMYEYT